MNGTCRSPISDQVSLRWGSVTLRPMSTVKFAPDRACLRADATGGDAAADNVCHSLCLPTLVRC